jgi:hypothetical protein
LATEVLGKQWREALFPLSHRFVGECEAAQQEHLGQIPQAELIAQSEKYNLENDVGGEFQMIERTTSPLVEPTLAPATAKDVIAEIGSLIELPSLTGLAVGTVHKGSCIIAAACLTCPQS